MGKPVTLLQGLFGHAMSFGADYIQVENINGHEWVFTTIDGEKARIGKYPTSGSYSDELLGNLAAAIKKPVRAVIEGKVYIFKVRVFDNAGKPAYEVIADLAPKPDASAPPRFTPKQGQYLAYIYHYTKIHRVPPAESDLERYFRVSPPSIHEMIKTLERNCLIERTPRQARSIRLLVPPECLPRLL